ncbi:MAG: peptide transporter TolQ [Phycisphaerae bacterium]|nr:peptide transporter TolQ [Phycisphaerae bacterium]
MTLSFELYASGILAQAGSDGEVSKSLLDYIAQGREIGFVIIALSLIATATIVAQMFFLRFARLAPNDHSDELQRLLRQGAVDEAIAYSEQQENDCVLTRIVGGALARCRRSPFGYLEIRSAVEEIGREQIARLHRMTEAVGLIASIAPMLGLLGTVVGMVGAFDTISLTEGPVRPDALAGNISEALITTVLGLIVAIPCTAAYSFLRGRVEQLASDIGETVEEIIAPLELGRASPAVGQAAAPQPQRATA